MVYQKSKSRIIAIIKNRPDVFILAGAALFFFVIGMLLPYTHDDWAWGSQIGLDRLNGAFANYNGRWGGNLLVIILTRSRFLRALAYASAFSSILYFSWRFASSNKRPLSLLWCFVFLLLIPRGQIAQVLSWTAGFSNYAAGTALMLPIVWIIYRQLFDNDSISIKRHSQHKNIYLTVLPVIFIIAFAAQLFVEHITIYLLILCIFAFAFDYIRHKKINYLLLILVIAAIAGTIIMFSNNAYSPEALSDPGNYQQIKLNNIGAIIIHAVGAWCGVVAPMLLLDNAALCLALSGISLLLLMKTKPRSYFLSALPSILLILLLIYRTINPIVFDTVPNSLSEIPLSKIIQCGLEGGAVISFFIRLVRTVLEFRDKNVCVRCMFLLVSICILTAPLLIATPIGPRNFFAAYILLTALLIQLSEQYISQSDFSILKLKKCTIKKIAATTASASCVVICTSYIIMFGYINICDNQRIEAVKEQIAAGDQVITLKALPFENYLHGSSPMNEQFEQRFKLFYCLPEDIEIIIQD